MARSAAGYASITSFNAHINSRTQSATPQFAVRYLRLREANFTEGHIASYSQGLAKYLV